MPRRHEATQAQSHAGSRKVSRARLAAAQATSPRPQPRRLQAARNPPPRRRHMCSSQEASATQAAAAQAVKKKPRRQRTAATQAASPPMSLSKRLRARSAYMCLCNCNCIKLCHAIYIELKNNTRAKCVDLETHPVS